MPLLAINHHYFRPAGNGRGIYPTTPEALREEVRKLREHGWRIGNQHDLQAFLAGRLADERIAIITFDDGLKEQMEAIDFLAKLDATALCYVPTAPLVDQVVLDVHKLHMIRSELEDAELAEDLDRRFGFGQQSFDDAVLAIQYRYDHPLSRRVKYFLNFMLEEAQRTAWTSDLFAKLFGEEAKVAAKLYMDTADIRDLGARGLLGSHAHAHLPLATLDRDAMRQELVQSFEMLSPHAEEGAIGISYPFGGKSAVSAAVFAQSEAIGYNHGFTMERGFNGGFGSEAGVDRRDSPFALKRIDVNDLDEWVVKGFSY